MTAQKKKPGRVIRVSDEVLRLLAQRKEKKQSWDSFFRWLIDLPQKERGRGKPGPALAEAWILPSSGKAYPSKAKAKGGAIMEAARSGAEPEQPIRMREVL